MPTTKDESVLTDRQREVLHLIRDDQLSNADTARRLGVGSTAISEHVRILRRKGFLPRRRNGGRGRQGARSQTRTTVGRSAATAKQNGNLAMDHIPSLPKAMDEIDNRLGEIDQEQHDLTTRQQELVEEQERLREQQNTLTGEAKNLGRMREAVKGALTPA